MPKQLLHSQQLIHRYWQQTLLGCALILFNTGAVSVLIGIGSSTITITAGNHLAFTDEDAPMNALMAKTASGTGALTIWEA